MDINNIKNKGGKPVFDLINQLKIKEMKNKFKDPNVLTETLVDLHLSGVSPNKNSNPVLFIFTIEFDDQMKANLLIDKTYQISKEYSKSMVEKILYKVYDDSGKKDITKKVESVFSFENLLFENYTNEDPLIEKKKDASNKNKNWVSVKTLDEKYHFINWKLYLEERFKSSGIDSTQINDEFTVNLSDEKYLERLNLVLSKVDGETLANYFEV